MNKNVIWYPQEEITSAVESYKTPFFLYDENKIRENCKNFVNSFGKYFNNFTPLYAVKANSNPHVLKIILDEGFGFDCSSPSEVFLANKFNAFGMHTGNYITQDEITQILATKSLLLNLDDISLLPDVLKFKTPEFISFRINPGMTGATQDSLVFAGPDAKYGVPWEKAVEAYKMAKEAGIKTFGIHMMTGSNVLNPDYFAIATEKLLEIAGKVHQELGIDFEYINIGGGFGVPYKPSEETLDLERIAKSIRVVFNKAIAKYQFKEPKLMVEPGRMIMADAGFLVTKVHVIKHSYKKFVGVDAGMNDLPRPANYGAYHHASVLGKDESAKTEEVSIVGRLCENNDQFAKNRLLPVLAKDNIIIIHNAGAHSYAMGHNYNGRTRSDEYLVHSDGTIEHIRRSETIEDLFKTVLNFS